MAADILVVDDEADIRELISGILEDEGHRTRLARDSDEALRDCELDVLEGADMLMVKPGMPYLDIIHRIKERFEMPTFAYEVSGEYSMIMAGAEKGFLDRDRAMMEAMTAFKRAGCDGVLTYFAPDIARLLNKGWRP